MAAPDLIGPEPRSTPSTLKSRGGSPRALPDDLLREASRRLGIVGLTGAVLWVTGPILEKLSRRTMDPTDPGWRTLGVPDLFALVGLLGSLSMYWYARKPNRDPQRVLDVGLVFQVLTALLIALLWHWQPAPLNMPTIPTITWVGVVILMFSAIVPTPPPKTLVTSLIAASMMPVAC